jgi:nitrogenase subunit NifH
LLKNKVERDQAIKETAEGQKADSQVKNLAPDAATQQEYYELAADILNNYKDNKDEEAMSKQIDEGKRDPSAFYKGLTQEQKDKIKALSEKLNPAVQKNP